MKIRNRTSQQEKRFFCILGIFLFSLFAANAKSHTMRAVSPDSIQIATPKAAPANPKVDEENSNIEDLDFDDDFSVLV